MVEGEPGEGVQEIQPCTQLGSPARHRPPFVSFVLDESRQPRDESHNEALLLLRISHCTGTVASCLLNADA